MFIPYIVADNIPGGSVCIKLGRVSKFEFLNFYEKKLLINFETINDKKSGNEFSAEYHFGIKVNADGTRNLHTIVVLCLNFFLFEIFIRMQNYYRKLDSVNYVYITLFDVGTDRDKDGMRF